MPDSVLVVGSTGTQGGAVATHLLTAGVDVHAMTRRPESEPAQALAERGATVVEADLDDRSSVADALEAVDTAFLVTDYFEHGGEIEVEQGTTFADAAVTADIDHVVFSSVASADADTGVRPFETKAEIESHLATVETPSTVVRPTYFMQNFEGMRDRISDGTLALALDPRVPLQLLDVADLGAAVTTILRDPVEYAGETIELAGDELTLDGMAVRLGDALNQPVDTVSVSDDQLREALGDDYADMFAWFNEGGFDVDLPRVRSRTGVDFSTFEDYLAENGWRS